MFKSLSIEGNKLRVTFDHVGSGLVSRDGKPLNWFEIIGKETDFVPAKAVIDGDSVMLSSPEVKEPVAVRFAWHKLAEPNLANKEGLPAVPFRAGEVPARDWLALKVKEATEYKLVYDLDLSKLGREVTYDVDNSASVTSGFDRIAYFLELQKAGEPTRYVYVSMDAFTQDVPEDRHSHGRQWSPLSTESQWRSTSSPTSPALRRAGIDRREHRILAQQLRSPKCDQCPERQQQRVGLWRRARATRRRLRLHASSQPRRRADDLRHQPVEGGSTARTSASATVKAARATGRSSPTLRRTR